MKYARKHEARLLRVQKKKKKKRKKKKSSI